MHRFAALLLAGAFASPLAGQTAAPAADTRVYGPAEVETQPRILNAADFHAALAESYPSVREAGAAGRVSVSFLVDAEGRVQDARVVSSTDPALDAPSLAAAGVLRLEPATVAGRPVATRVELPIEWAAEPPSSVYELSEVEVEPRVLNGEEVRALLTSAGLGLEGVASGGASADVRMLVGADGEVKQAAVARSSGLPAFDELALAVARMQRHEPARIAGAPVDVWVEHPYEVRIPREGAVVYRMRDEREGRPRLRNGDEFNRMLYRRMPDWESAAPLTFTVDLLIELDERGRPREVSLIRGSGQERVDAAVLGAAEGLRFTPAVVDGRRVPISLYYQLSVEKPAESRNRQRVRPPRHPPGMVPRPPLSPPPSGSR